MTPAEIAEARKECSEGWSSVHSARMGWSVALDEIERLREALRDVMGMAESMSGSPLAGEGVRLVVERARAAPAAGQKEG